MQIDAKFEMQIRVHLMTLAVPLFFPLKTKSIFLDLITMALEQLLTKKYVLVSAGMRIFREMKVPTM